MSTYLRYPHITGDHIVFVADDDVWMCRLRVAGAPSG